MSSNLPEPQRWSDGPSRGGSSAEDGIGSSLRQARQATEPSDAALARVARGLDAPPPRSRAALLVLRAALVVLLIVATGSAVGAALYRWWGGEAAEAPRAGSPASAPARPPARAHGRRHLPAAPLDGPAPVAEEGDVTPAPAPGLAPEPAPPAPTMAIDRRAPALRPARARPPFDEGNDLARVFRALRSDGDAAAALRALDEHDRRFPRGVLATEARLARAEALVALNRRAEALPLLVGIEDRGDGLTPAARVMRGELLADARRCDEAVRDFAAVLSVSPDGPAGARALYGRARCRQQAGDVAATRRDLEQLLSLSADDRLAAAARRLLESLPP